MISGFLLQGPEVPGSGTRNAAELDATVAGVRIANSAVLNSAQRRVAAAGGLGRARDMSHLNPTSRNIALVMG